MEQYSFVKKLGEGAYGTVVKCVNKHTQELVAIKKLKSAVTNQGDLLSMPEVATLQKLNQSAFVIKLKQIIHNKKDNEVNIVFEYADRSLLNEMQDRARWNQHFT